jgi:DNA polymerase-3 subunit gamma/tau
MGKALYRKYRSRSLAEVVGQDHVTQTLANALAQGKIAHAYLLTGPRGVGKTSVARILAHEINGLGYSEEPHFDIIEIDAASNNSVEDVRDLRTKIMAAPTSAPYKVFIIDEVHMLSKAAFNALLKTLEEPPAHVVFVLATTESHKLPATIISRTQRYSFRPVPLEIVTAHLASLAQQENITIDPAALTLIAEHGGGSFRDSISLLDQASSIDTHITLEHIETLLGRAPQATIAQMYQAVANGDSATVHQAYTAMLDQGYEPAVIALQLGSLLRNHLVDAPNDTAGFDTLGLLRQLLDVPAAHNPGALLELVLLETARSAGAAAQPTSATATAAPAHHSNPQPPVATAAKPLSPTTTASASHEPVAPDDPVTTTPPKATPSKTKVPAATAPATEPSPAADTPSSTPDPQPPTDQSFDDLWQQTLAQLKRTHNTLYGIARMAEAQLRDDTLTLALKFSFHQKRLQEPRNHAALTAVVEAVRGKPTRVQCRVVDKGTPAPTHTSQPDQLAAISNIFGSAELL